ncbi:hypothetical protein FACS189419_08810 [Planctomycetales bacterium]|nr:hypothetical protein FACS189419_08810 [Planctomycetales bacterium]
MFDVSVAIGIVLLYNLPGVPSFTAANNTFITMEKIISLAVFFLILTVAGCNSPTNIRGLVPASGTLTLDGQIFAGANIQFVLEKGAAKNARSGTAVSGTDGRFTAMTLQVDDGLFPGTYKVTVSKIEVEPYTAGQEKMLQEGKSVPPQAQKELVPKIFTDKNTTPIKLTIEAGGSKDLKIDVKSK